MTIIRIHEIDDENNEVFIDDEIIAKLSHDNIGWKGVEMVISVLEAVAESIDTKIIYSSKDDDHEEEDDEEGDD